MSEIAARTLGRYRLETEIGRGMMGVVYLARDPDLGRAVALKTVHAPFAASDKDRDSFEKRFLAEARAAAALSHPGIVVVHDVGRDAASGTLYIAFERLEGRTLADITAGGARLDWGKALEITARVAEALDHAHARRIVHRDVKPSNVMVLPSGKPKIMDFGIAKLSATQLTSTGEFLGTPAYMSPEQLAGEELDGRSDLFSLGGVLYLLLTGRHAFEASTVAATLARILHQEPLPVSRVVPELPPEVDRIVARALAKRPEDRYPNGRSLAADIEAVLEGRPAAGVAEPAARTGEAGATATRLGRRGVLVTGGLIAAGLAAAALFVPRGSAVPSAPAADVPPRAVPPARLELRFEHDLKGGTLRVWVDEKLVFEAPLRGRVTEDLVVMRMRRGREEMTLDVPPGEHEIRVQVIGERSSASRRIRGSFESGALRRLEARYAGLIKKELSLAWGPPVRGAQPPPATAEAEGESP